jgi:hypothetical protein
MLFMVIERFRDNDMVPIYQRLQESGRSLPEGLEYVDSWIEPYPYLAKTGSPNVLERRLAAG